MKLKDILDLLILSALWGASFLFMRIAAPEFGPVALIELRVAIAALFLLPVFLSRGDIAELKSNWKHMALVGTLNSALPFWRFSSPRHFTTWSTCSYSYTTAPKAIPCFFCY